MFWTASVDWSSAPIGFVAFHAVCALLPYDWALSYASSDVCSFQKGQSVYMNEHSGPSLLSSCSAVDNLYLCSAASNSAACWV